MTFSVCIFAYNEERLLPETIGALGRAAAGRPYKAHIVENGSKDETLRVAEALAQADDRITVHALSVADKSNAWNTYVHDIAPKSDVKTHVFLDGDITPSDGSFAAMEDAFVEAPKAYGAGALPITGRSRKGWATTLLENHYISGNLYALTAEAMTAIRERNIYMPFGAKGEDGILSYLLLTDLKGGEDDSHRHRIINPPDATFQFTSLGLTLDDALLYHRRLKRYSERHFQKHILFPLLKREGVSAMPENIYDIYSQEALAQVQVRTDPINYVYDMRMRKKLAARFADKPYSDAASA